MLHKFNQESLADGIVIGITVIGTAAVLSTPFLGFAPTIAFVLGLIMAVVVVRLLIEGLQAI